MASFANIREYVDAMNGGSLISSSFCKIPSQVSIANWWTDYSMAGGNPRPNYYAGSLGVASTLSDWYGIFHGDDKAPAEKYLTELMAMTPTANMVGVYRLLDYLLYYIIDFETLATQTMVNTQALTRYTTGEGVLPMLVAVTPTTGGGGSFTFDYIDHNGNTTTSPVNYYSTTAANIAAIVTSEPAQTAGMGPFLRLASGDTGIRRILSFTNRFSNGGFGALVLVKPLADIRIDEINTSSEVTLINMKPGPPKIYDGAYLNFIGLSAGSVQGGFLVGRANFTWK